MPCYRAAYINIHYATTKEHTSKHAKNAKMLHRTEKIIEEKCKQYQ
jgi:hypothetical protein